MENKKLEIPGKEVFVYGGKLGYKENQARFMVSEPEVIGISELRYSMINRGWLQDEHDVYETSSKKLYRKRARNAEEISEPRPIPKYKVTDEKFVLLGSQDSIEDDEDSLSEYLSDLEEFTLLYNKYIMMKEDNIGEFKNVISTRDILQGTSEVCLLCPHDGSYTNIINLNSIQGNPTQLRVGVAYSKGSDLYSKDLIVPTKSDVESGDLCYITTGPREFRLEYSDGCIRVFPGSSEVTECVISYCYLTYEHLI